MGWEREAGYRKFFLSVGYSAENKNKYHRVHVEIKANSYKGGSRILFNTKNKNLKK
jgi:hypothetical protein